MVVEILNQKYKCGCGRGLNKLDQENILRNINTVMEWNLCSWPLKLRDDWDATATDSEGNLLKPEKSDYVEDKLFLGEDPELKPGDCFLYKGQVIAIDSPDRIVLIVSETGAWALNRIYQESIKPEFELVFNSSGELDVVWEDLADDPSEAEFDEEVRLPSYLYGIWRERFLSGREQEIKVSSSGQINISCTITSPDIPFEAHIILQNYSALYKTSEFDDEDTDIIKDLVRDLLYWFCDNYPRKVNPLEIDKKKTEEMNAKQEEASV